MEENFTWILNAVSDGLLLIHKNQEKACYLGILNKVQNIKWEILFH